jgi:hypothetical protein
MLAGMTGVHGSGLPLPVAAWRFLRFEGLRESLIQHGFIALVPSTRPWETVTLPLFKNSLLVIGLGVIAWGAPNSIQMLGKWSPALQKVREIAWKRLEWQPNLAWAAGLGLVLCYVLTQLGTPGRFLYFQF